MADDSFKYPPGIRTASEWSRGESFSRGDIEAIQQDAVIAARRERAMLSDMRKLLGDFLDTTWNITPHNIGEIRRTLFLPFECPWNAIVREETAARELSAKRRAANNAAHKEKVCRCVLTSSNKHLVYNYGGVKMCGYCNRPVL